MSRWLVFGALLLAGCGEGGEPRGVVARVDDWTLGVDRLADLLVLAQPFPLEVEAAAPLVHHWIGVAALARWVADGHDATRDAAVRESLWLERREALLEADRERRLGDRIPEPDRDDFEEGTWRLVAHVLRRVGPEISTEERRLQRRAAEGILADLLDGAPWDSAVARSEDAATAGSSGLLGVVRRGELPEALDRVAFRLEPGQVSSVVESPEGFHILYRPRWEDVAELFPRRLRERWLAEADAASGAELRRERGVEPAPDAVSRLREIARDPLAWWDRDAPLASWRGGALAAGTAARYVAAVPAADREAMAAAAESDLESLLQVLAVREIRVTRAAADDPEGLATLERRLRRQHREEVEDWLSRLDIAEGRPVTRGTVAAYMERLVSRRRPTQALPPLLRGWLLRRVEWMGPTPRIADAVTRARSMLDASGAAREEDGPGAAS